MKAPDTGTLVRDLDVLVDGPVWYRLLVSGAPLDAAFRRTLIAAVTRAARPQ